MCKPARGAKFTRTTLAKAHELQGRYDQLGASAYQAVRNPLPMHKLVLTVLPTLPLPSSQITVDREIKTTALGRSFIRHQTATDSAYDALGREFYEQNALSVDEVVAKLQAKGYIVRHGTVAMALNNGRWNANVQSMRFNRDSQTGMRKNVSFARYFVAA